LIEYFRYMFKMEGPSANTEFPSRDSAPVFAARVVWEDKPFTNVLTETTNTCPSYSPTMGFQGGDCLVPDCKLEVVRGPEVFQNGPLQGEPIPKEGQFIKPNKCRYDHINQTDALSPFVVQMASGQMKKSMPDGKHSGVLTNPGVMSLFFGNLAFRRNRWIHETFLCKSANEQAGGEPAGEEKLVPKNPPCSGGTTIPGYQNKWEVDVIAGQCNGGRVDFHTYTNGNICANCHATWNHRAPLFARFDEQGLFDPNNYQVAVPVEGSPVAMLSDWLCVDPQKCPNGGNNGFAWKKNYKSINDGMEKSGVLSGADTPALIADMAKKMADDEEVAQCAVKRMWYYAMGRSDITTIGDAGRFAVLDRKNPPPELLTLTKLTQEFKKSNFNLKEVLRTILKSDDFVRF
jgi:hypothetical protein